MAACVSEIGGMAASSNNGSSVWRSCNGKHGENILMCSKGGEISVANIRKAKRKRRRRHRKHHQATVYQNSENGVISGEKYLITWRRIE